VVTLAAPIVTAVTGSVRVIHLERGDVIHEWLDGWESFIGTGYGRRSPAYPDIYSALRWVERGGRA
jgi:hypothetical protein